MTLPHFLGIGVPKAGTTWLYENLRQHPQVWLPPLKEIHYFDRGGRPYLLDGLARNAQKRYRFRRWLIPALADLWQAPSNLGWYIRFFAEVRTPTWYHSLFHPEADQIAGDITPTYSVLSEAKIAQVAELLPTAKLILILRDPLERIWSHAAMYFSRYGQRGLEAAPRDAIVAFLNRPDVRQRSDYLTILAHWERFFPPEQLYIGFYEQLRRDPVRFFQTICHFLAIPPIVPPHITARIHSRSYPPLPSWAIEQLMPHYRPALEGLQARFDNNIIDAWLRNGNK
jgi:hypothetical protein